MQNMSLSKQIIEDWGSLKHFAKKTGVNYQYLRSTISGQQRLKDAVNVLIKFEYITSVDDLPKKENK